MDIASFVKSQFRRERFSVKGDRFLYTPPGDHNPPEDVGSPGPQVVVVEKKGTDEHSSGLITFKFRLQPKPDWLWTKIFQHCSDSSGKLTIRGDELLLLTRPDELARDYEGAKESLQYINKLRSEVVTWMRNIAVDVQNQKDQHAAAEAARKEGIQTAMASLKL